MDVKITHYITYLFGLGTLYFIEHVTIDTHIRLANLKCSTCPT